MKRRQAILKACFLLRKHAKEESLARFLLMYLLDENSNTFNVNLDNELNSEVEDKYFLLINKHIENNVPLSHLVGFEYFYGRKFKVTSDVLSPRMETEELIYEIIKYVKEQNLTDIKILDMCTGSGIIAITLQQELASYNVKISASDISEAALKITKYNVEELNSTVEIIHSDLFENIKESYDIIVSNPPYISYADKSTIEDNVLNFDPHIALFAEEDGMYFYRKIIEQAENNLTDKGIIFFEIGYDQKEKITLLGEKNNYRVTVLKDINKNDRIAILKKRDNSLT